MKINKYSILIPNYGYNVFLKDCLLSSLEQINTSKYHVEIIFCDQSNLEDYKKITNLIESVDKNRIITVFRLGKPSILVARKELLKKATGDYIVFLDSDDYLDDLYLERIDNFLRNNDYPDVVINNFCMVDMNKAVLKAQLPVPGDINDNILDYYYYSNYLNSIVRKIFKKELFHSDEVPLADVRNGDDWLISFPIMKNAKSILFTNDCFGYFYRQNPSSSTHFFNRKVALSSLYFKDNIIDLEMNNYQRSLYLKQKIYDFINFYKSLVTNKAINKKEFILDSRRFRNNVIGELKLKSVSKKLLNKQKLVFLLLKWKLYSFIYISFKL